MKTLIFAVFFFILAVVNSSFLAHFSLFGVVPNILLILVVVLSIFENPHDSFGLFVAMFGGFFLDVFSQGLFGIWVVLCITLSLCIKILKRTYVRVPAH